MTWRHDRNEDIMWSWDEFDEFIENVIVAACFVFYLIGMGLVGYATYHFVVKYW